MSDNICLRWTDVFRPYISHLAIPTRISPGPAKAVIEHRKRVAGLELKQLLGIVRWPHQQGPCPRYHPLQRLGVMRGDNLVGECTIGEVGTVSVIGGVRRV